MPHTIKQLSEAELMVEIERINGTRYNHAPTIVTEGSGDASNAEIETGQPTALTHAEPSPQPKKRGRPKGSRNKSKLTPGDSK